MKGNLLSWLAKFLGPAALQLGARLLRPAAVRLLLGLLVAGLTLLGVQQVGVEVLAECLKL